MAVDGLYQSINKSLSVGMIIIQCVRIGHRSIFVCVKCAACGVWAMLSYQAGWIDQACRYFVRNWLGTICATHGHISVSSTYTIAIARRIMEWAACTQVTHRSRAAITDEPNKMVQGKMELWLENCSWHEKPTETEKKWKTTAGAIGHCAVHIVIYNAPERVMFVVWL